MVSPPTCGLTSTFGTVQSGWLGGSGSGSVTSSAATSRPEASSATSASVTTTGPQGDVHEQRAVGHRREERRVDHAPGGIRQRARQHDDLVPRQQLGQLGVRVHVAAGVVPGRGSPPG